MFHAKPEPNTSPPVSSGAANIIRIVEAIKSELRCGICCSTLKNPVITTCNHLFCRTCYTECLKQLKSLTCPMCKQKLSRRSSNEVDIYTNVVSNYLQLAKAFSRDLQPLNLRPDDNFLESQAVVAPGSAPSPLRNFQPPLFAVPTLPSRRKGKRSAGDNEAPSAKRKHLKLEVIGEEEEAPPIADQVKRETVTPPPDAVKEERKSEEPIEPPRRSSRGKSAEKNNENPVEAPLPRRSSRCKSVDRRSAEPVEPPVRRSSRGKSAANGEKNALPIEANLDNDPAPISLVPYSQSSIGSSIVPPTQSQGDQRVEKIDASTQSEEQKTTSRDEIEAFRASNPSSSSLSDLALLLKIRPELSNILMENRDELSCLFFPRETTPLPKGRLRQSEVLAQCFATPTGHTDDESEGGLPTKGSSALPTPVGRSQGGATIGMPVSRGRSTVVIQRTVVVDGDKDDDLVPRLPPRANTNPVDEKEKTLIEKRREERESSQEKTREETSGESSLQAERGEVEREEGVTEVKKEDNEWSDEEEEKEETIAATPEPSEKGDDVIILEKEEEKEVEEEKAADIETDPFAFDGSIPPPASPLKMRRGSSTRSIKENTQKASSISRSAPREESYDSFNDSYQFDTVQEKTQPLGEINLTTMQRTPSRRSPRKTITPAKKESFPDSFDEECESPEGIVITLVGATGSVSEEMVADFRSLFPTIKFVQQAEKGATHLVVLDSVSRHVPSISSLQLASAHACKCTVLCREWMERCIAKKKLLDTSPFGIVSVHRGEAPAWQRAKVEAPLLLGYTILLPNNFADSKTLPRDRLCAIITKCGGKVVDRPWKLPKTRTPVDAGSPLNNVHSMRSFILFSPGSADSDSAMRFERDTCVAVFAGDWLLDSLCQYSVIITDTDKYRVALKSLF